MKFNDFKNSSSLLTQLEMQEIKGGAWYTCACNDGSAAWYGNYANDARAADRASYWCEGGGSCSLTGFDPTK